MPKGGLRRHVGATHHHGGSDGGEPRLSAAGGAVRALCPDGAPCLAQCNYCGYERTDAEFYEALEN